jgi:hypothetical protein
VAFGSLDATSATSLKNNKKGADTGDSEGGVQNRKHRRVMTVMIAEWIAEAAELGLTALSEPVQLDLFDQAAPFRKPRPGRPRTARVVYRGSNRRGFRRE